MGLQPANKIKRCQSKFFSNISSKCTLTPFSPLFSIILVSLDDIQDHLENPFDQVGEDDVAINVEEFLERLY